MKGFLSVLAAILAVMALLGIADAFMAMEAAIWSFGTRADQYIETALLDFLVAAFCIGLAALALRARKEL